MTKNVTILIADDDPSHRMMLNTLLTQWGYTVFEAHDGEMAIEKVRAQKFHLILMDIRMPKMSGLDAMAVIKRINPALPIIIMTAYASLETAENALKNGASAYLSKPIDFDHLRLAITRTTKNLNPLEETLQRQHTLTQPLIRHTAITPNTMVPQFLDSPAQGITHSTTAMLSGGSRTVK
ncbi:response regulator [Desulfoluna sp.]|uniref:sigma-54-dependent transcriptional regulator n=1 Tax=Desulfoluna sp. TaxID=2045199 RepID=UPI0026200B5A|nr:response regulator [Desulfoluna sp.]